MTNIQITGEWGTGKTIFLVMLALTNPNIDVYSNFELKLKNYHKLTISSLFELKNGLVFFDEGYSQFDSRLSSSLLNRFITSVLFQMRKSELDFYTTSQDYYSIDVRFRRTAKYVIISNEIEDFGYIYTFYKKVFMKDIYNKVGMFLMPYNKAALLYKYYNTNEKVKSAQYQRYNYLLGDNKEQLALSLNYAKQYLRDMKEEDMKSSKINHDNLRLFLRRNDIDLVYEKDIYLFAKEILKKKIDYYE